MLTLYRSAPPQQYGDFLFDLGSIQVLRALRTLGWSQRDWRCVLIQRPCQEMTLAGYPTLRAGNARLQARAIDLPIVTDKLAIRLASDYTKGDGYIKNVSTGNTLGDKDNKSGRDDCFYAHWKRSRTHWLFNMPMSKERKNRQSVHHYTIGGNGSQFINNGITSVRNTNGLCAWAATLDVVLHNLLSPFIKNKIISSGIATSHPTGLWAPGKDSGGVAGYAAWSRANPYKDLAEFDLPHKAHNTFIAIRLKIEASDLLKVKNIFSWRRASRTGQYLPAGRSAHCGCIMIQTTRQVYRAPVVRAADVGPPRSKRVVKPGGSADDRPAYPLVFIILAPSGLKSFLFMLVPDLDPVITAGPFDLLPDIDYTYHAKDTSKAVYAQLTYKFTDKLGLPSQAGVMTWKMFFYPSSG